MNLNLSLCSELPRGVIEVTSSQGLWGIPITFDENRVERSWEERGPKLPLGLPVGFVVSFTHRSLETRISVLSLPSTSWK